MLALPAFLRFVGLPEERGAAVASCGVTGGEAVGVCLFTVEVDTGVWPGEGADSGVVADVVVAQDEENKGVCVEAVLVHGLEAERED